MDNSLDQFPPEIDEDVEGLLWLGYLEDSFEFAGHDFVIRTLRGEEELLASLITKEYVETLGQAKAWAWAHISLALVSIDGDEYFCPPASPSTKDGARARFQYCTKKWYWPVASYIYDRYADLLNRQLACLESLQTKSMRSPIFSTASPDSSTQKADSSTPQHTLELLEEED